jgi:DnaJ-class molecular chaperone
MLPGMTQSDRHIPENARCSTCNGVGWTPWSPEGEEPGESKWIVCRSCIGTGRTDQKGRKRLKPADAPSA